MAMQYFEQAGSQNDFNGEDKSSSQKWKSAAAPINGCDYKPCGGFDCNICLDSVQDPVVTFCGHLYCWPCIYKWLQYQNDSIEIGDQQQQQCPVCKAEVSQNTLVPLYGRGQTTKPSKGAPNFGIVIPRRPLAPICGDDARISPMVTTNPHPAPQLRHHNYHQQWLPDYPHPASYGASQLFSVGGTTSNLFEPVGGMIGEIVYERIFGNPITNLYTNSNNSYRYGGVNSPRMRRHLMQTDRSLNRICIFLFCCLLWCLLLF